MAAGGDAAGHDEVALISARPSDGEIVGDDDEVALISTRPSDGEIVGEIARMGLPTLIIHGANDAVVPLSNSQRLAALLGCPLVTIDQ